MPARFIFQFLFFFGIVVMLKSLKYTAHIQRRKFVCNVKASQSTYTFSQIDCNIIEENKNIVKPKVLFVLGGPGAGKGTQCEKLSAEYGMKHLSAGELLREERLSGSLNGNLIESYLKDGKIVPVQITLDLLRKAMYSTNSNRYLVDGFPRNWDNIQGWDSCMPDVCDVEAVLFIECPEEELQKRLLSRGLTSGRSDDNIDTAKKRFATFKDTTVPLLQHFKDNNKLLKIRGDMNIEAVFAAAKDAIEPYLQQEIKELNQRLLEAISSSDWATYKSLCDPSLTCFEGEAKVLSLASSTRE